MIRNKIANKLPDLSKIVFTLVLITAVLIMGLEISVDKSVQVTDQSENVIITTNSVSLSDFSEERQQKIKTAIKTGQPVSDPVIVSEISNHKYLKTEEGMFYRFTETKQLTGLTHTLLDVLAGLLVFDIIFILLHIVIQRMKKSARKRKRAAS